MTTIDRALLGPTSRRGVLKLAGAAALLVAAAPGASQAALAQDATPVASPTADTLLGKYLVIRTRTVKPDRSVEELLTLVQQGYVPLVQEIPGFILYVSGADAETHGQYSIGVFEDEAGAAESTRRAREWGALGASDMVEGDPDIYEGTIGVAADPSLPADGLLGAYAVIRLRQPNPGWPVADVLARIGEGYVPLVEAIPGYIAYFGSADGAGGSQAYVGLYADRTAGDESSRIARDWLTANNYDFFAGDPTLAEGPIGAAAEMMG